MNLAKIYERLATCVVLYDQLYVVIAQAKCDQEQWAYRPFFREHRIANIIL